MKDKCVVCKKDSHHNKDEHIKVRIGYIEGSGQLCLNCYDDIYNIKKSRGKNDNKNNSTIRYWKFISDL